MTRQNRTVLFCDCHHFMRLFVELGDTASSVLQSLYQRGGECIVSAGGRIIKYLGDSILATFPYGAAGAAVEAGRCLRLEYAAIIADMDAQTETELEVGISAGPVFEGTVGHESLKAFDVFGACVSEAAVIGHYRGIALTAPVKDQLSPEVTVREIEPFAPKWQSEPLRVWEVVEA